MTIGSSGRAALTVALALALSGCASGVSSAPSPSESARPTRSPIPTLAAGMTRFTGTVTDASGRPVPGVCVIIGPPIDCLENMPHSNDEGRWFADLPVAGGLSWTFTFVKEGYALATAKGVSDAPGEKTVDVTLQAK